MIEQFFKGLEGQPYQLFSLYTTPEDPAQSIDSRQFLLEVRRWAIRFQPHSEPVVAIFGRMTLSMCAAWFGAILAGKLPAFISHPSRKIQAVDYEKKLANYTERFQSCLLVGEEQERIVAPNLLSPNDLAHDFIPNAVEWPVIHATTPLFLQCSSGTTGLQKSVAITSGMLTAQLRAYAEMLALNPQQDRIISWLPLYHDMGLAGVFLLALLTKTPLYLVETFAWAANPTWLLKLIQQHQGTLCWLPNFAFSLLAKVGGRFDLSSMRAFINCSEPVSTGAFERFMTAFDVNSHQLSVCYALAENVFAATQTPLGHPPKAMLVERMALSRRQVEPLAEWQLGEKNPLVPPNDNNAVAVFNCGTALPGVSIRIATRSEYETIGEIWLQSDSTVMGYYHQEPLQTEGWLPTGDLGFLHQGDLFVSGRIKDLIIHNGKNLHPQDLEAIVSEHETVYSGRVAAMGRMDAEVDSEQVLLLFEPVRFLSLKTRRIVCQTMQRQLDVVFDIRSMVDCVPRNWLRKTSSGKMARLENLKRYDTASQTTVHLIGDSHVRIFWSNPTSHHSRFKQIHAHWVGVLWSENWEKSIPFLSELIPRLQPTDILILQSGEPECRSLFAVAADPEKRIEKAVAGYRLFFQQVRQMWPGRLAYMTGIPTHPHAIDNGDRQWPLCGTPMARYHWQKRFYQAMQPLCLEFQMHFIDLCTPLLGADGWMDPVLLADKVHLDPKHTDLLLERFETHFGYLNFSPNTPPPEQQIWNGCYEHFVDLMQQKIRILHPLMAEQDWHQLVSAGILDSLSIVELVAMLDKTFNFKVRLDHLQREDFESITRIWQRLGPDQSPI